MGQIVALVDDLFFIAKMQESARQVGAQLKTVSTGPALVQAAADPAVTLLIVDLNARAGAIQALEELKLAGSHKPAIAFLSHVQTELAERAKATGCEQVMPRSQFTANLGKILSMAKS